nr:DNA methyltransferase [Bradyrhizobium zhengyangense]
MANTQSFINGLCTILGVHQPHGSREDDSQNDYVFERRVFQDNGDGTSSFGRIDCYKRNCFVLEAKQGSDADRAAVERNELDLDLFGQTAATRLKRGTARRGTPAWVKAMTQAKGQAERYAKALPMEHGWPPFLLVCDVGYCVEVYADFTGMGKAYTQFPDRSRYRVMLADLRDGDVRKRLAAIWTEPLSLDPSKEALRVTREIGELLAILARRLENRGHTPSASAAFLMRLLFTMFAEDTSLIPKDSFSQLLKRQRGRPELLKDQLSELWSKMDTSGFVGALGLAGEKVRQFNGYLFKDHEALALDAEELDVLIKAAEYKWTLVEPAVFGTLLERALDPKERAKLGAHFTPPASVERLIIPTIMDPLRGEWAGVKTAVVGLLDQERRNDAVKVVRDFHRKLAKTLVLDPACGTGNFLYVAMAKMKELEAEVIELTSSLGSYQEVLEITGRTITPENFLGIEINPRAAAIAQLVLWIGYLQWHFRTVGADKMPPEPVLRDVQTIETRDAVVDWDNKILATDEGGTPITVWDGFSVKPHGATGELIPDETARIETFRYVGARAAKWPRADFIVGNPPFIGNKRMRKRLGAGYVEAVRSAHPALSQEIDFVMYWWDHAARLVASGRVKPERDQNDRQSYKENWWLFAEPRPRLRQAVAGLDRFIVTSETSKHRIFRFIEAEGAIVDGSVIAIASDDAYVLGVLSSRVHRYWAERAGGRQGAGNDPRYQNEVCFDPFPFPRLEEGDLKNRIRAAAEALDAFQTQLLHEHPDLTLTEAYNVVQKLRTNTGLLNSEDRSTYDRAHLRVLQLRLVEIDEAVCKAYGFAPDASVDDVLASLVALNLDRSVEEASGTVRYIRPTFQARGKAREVAQTLEFSLADSAAPTVALQWPDALSDQVVSVAGVLAGARRPLAATDVAKAFAGKRAATVTPVLDALAAIGQARRLSDGRYAV